MAADLVPDLRAASAAARKAEDRAQFGAAFHLIPQTFIAPDGTAYQVGPDCGLATERAWQALADRYEARALRAAARGEADR